MSHSSHLKRFAAVFGATAVAFAAAFTSASHAGLANQIGAQQDAAATLQQQIAADSNEIATTSGGLKKARAHLAAVQAALTAREDELRTVQVQLLTAREHLLQLENKLRAASNALAANLRYEYENGAPNLMTVILQAKGFDSLLDQVSFQQRVARYDAQVVTMTKTARAYVLRETTRLGNLESRDRTLTNDILSQRNQVAAYESAVLKKEISEQRARAGARSKLASVRDSLNKLQSQLNAVEQRAAAEAQQTGTEVNQQIGGIAINTGGMVSPIAGAPAAVNEMIAAGNAIATLPYIWGGGHGSFQSPGYDCSGSVSYVLGAAGLLSSPEDSAGFASYGSSGNGSWVTLWVDPGVHVWMEIGGWRFDTVALSETGTRWARGGGEFAGFSPRHPSGL
jgi:cell wall-associated NlpC family hydrolase